MSVIYVGLLCYGQTLIYVEWNLVYLYSNKIVKICRVLAACFPNKVHNNIHA